MEIRTVAHSVHMQTDASHYCESDKQSVAIARFEWEDQSLWLGVSVDMQGPRWDSNFQEDWTWIWRYYWEVTVRNESNANLHGCSKDYESLLQASHWRYQCCTVCNELVLAIQSESISCTTITKEIVADFIHKNLTDSLQKQMRRVHHDAGQAVKCIHL